MQHKTTAAFNWRTLRACSGALIACFLSGCTVVHFAGDAANVRVERHFGILRMQVGASTHALIAETTVLGFGSDPLGMTFGFGHSRVAFLPPDCRIVVWNDSVSAARAWKSALADIDAQCSVFPLSTGDAR